GWTCGDEESSKRCHRSRTRREVAEPARPASSKYRSRGRAAKATECPRGCPGSTGRLRGAASVRRQGPVEAAGRAQQDPGEQARGGRGRPEHEEAEGVAELPADRQPREGHVA